MTQEIQQEDAVAIIGMSCRFPDAPDPETYWKNLMEGRVSIRKFSDRDLSSAGIPEDFFSSDTYVPYAATLDGVDLFDAPFFGYTRKEAARIDPQQRMLLECVYAAIEDGGYGPFSLDDTVGVFCGTRASGYARLLERIIARNGTRDSFDTLLGNTIDQTALRISYALDFTGPSLCVQSACATSLTAVHLACDSLLSGQCDMAVAAAAAIAFPQEKGHFHEADMIFSPDGNCRPFDADASGTVAGHGMGVVVLKRLADALEDRDPVRAVILGTAINNDGGRKAGYRAPGLTGQTRVVADALEMAGIASSSIGFFEAHGTGTFLGDAIEITALSRAFAGSGKTRGTCCLGSAKANIGHLVQACGMAGLIKTVLAVETGYVPPQPQFSSPNPTAPLADSPFQINTVPTPWPVTTGPRRAGVSAFAIGGTNAAVILESAPVAPETAKTQPDAIGFIPVSAPTFAAAKRRCRQVADLLRSQPLLSVEAIGSTLARGRDHFPFRFAATGSRKELIAALEKATPVCRIEGESLPPVRPTTSEQNRSARFTSFAAAYTAGQNPDWNTVFPSETSRVRLPTYPFSPISCWYDPTSTGSETKQHRKEETA